MFELHVQGRVIPLKQGTYQVGRSHESTLSIPDENISRQHAIVEVRGDTLLIQDLNSTNGTFVNEQRVTPNSWVRVMPGSRVRFGTQVVASIRYLDTAPPEQATSVFTVAPGSNGGTGFFTGQGHAARPATQEQPRPQPFGSPSPLASRAILDIALERSTVMIALAGMILLSLFTTVTSPLIAEIGFNPISWIVSFFVLVSLLTLQTIVMAALTVNANHRLRHQHISFTNAYLQAIQIIPTLFTALVLVAIAAGAFLFFEMLLLFVGRVPQLGELLVALLVGPLTLVHIILLVLFSNIMLYLYPVAANHNLPAHTLLLHLVKVWRKHPGAAVQGWLGAVLGSTLVMLGLLLVGAVGLLVTFTVVGAALGPVRLAEIIDGVSLSILGNLLSPLFPIPQSGASFQAAAWLFQLSLNLLIATLFAIPLAYQMSAITAAYQRLISK